MLTLLVAVLAGLFWQRAELAEQQAIATAQLNLARALVAKGENIFKERPLLGLRLALEGQALVPVQ
jgi:hypothetical protein